MSEAVKPADSPPVVFLMGPTGAGKTDVAVALASRLGCEIISVDSAMVYKQMDIGTGKPDAATLAHAAHRLIDIREPHQTYSAAEFRADALREIDAIRARGKLPLLVGGTGLYFRALSQGLADLPAADAAIREKLLVQADTIGWHEMHRRLAGVDPESARRIHPHDQQRIQRALEVFELTGTAISRHFQESRSGALSAPIFKIVLTPERAVLHQRIEQRFDGMLAAGLVDEVRRLKARPELHRELPAMRAVGYRQVWEFLDGNVDPPSMRLRAVAATRQLARRQLTWLRALPGCVWLDSSSPDTVDTTMKLFADKLS